MILNLRPMDMGLLDCVIEECDERFSAGQQGAILGIVAEVLGGVTEGGNGLESAEGGNEGMALGEDIGEEDRNGNGMKTAKKFVDQVGREPVKGR